MVLFGIFGFLLEFFDFHWNFGFSVWNFFDFFLWISQKCVRDILEWFFLLSKQKMFLMYYASLKGKSSPKILLGDRSIFKGTWNREICNETTTSFWRRALRGHQLFWYGILSENPIVSMRGHGKYRVQEKRSFRIEISTGPWKTFNDPGMGWNLHYLKS